MKKFIIGVLCFVGLLMVTVVNQSDSEIALRDKPEITAINLYI